MRKKNLDILIRIKRLFLFIALLITTLPLEAKMVFIQKKSKTNFKIEVQIKESNCFIDSAVQGSEALLKQVETSNAFHLFSHGKSGELLLEDQWRNASQIANWLKAKKLLHNKTHLNIYGCNFAQGEKGKAAVSYLETVLSVSIAASDDITGIDGDWELEVGTPIVSLAIENYTYNLGLKSAWNDFTSWVGSFFEEETNTTASSLMMTCTGTIGGTDPTDDFDGDGYCNDVDLDDDNDGILDTEENPCNFLNISNAIRDSAVIGVTNQTINNIDVSATFGLPTGSVIVSATGVNRPVGALTVSDGLPTTFTISGTRPIKLRARHGSTLAIGDFDGIVSLDGVSYMQTSALDAGFVATTTGGNTYRITNNNPSGGDTQNSSHFFWISDNYATSIRFETSTGDNAAIVLQACADLDTDNDNIADYLDLDSDGDGCPDAIEGGGTFTTADIQNDTLTGGVDANGIPTVATASGQTVGDSQDESTIVCCDALATGFADNDSDGVSDLCDLDDDNDGILDTDECNIVSISSAPFANWVPINGGDPSDFDVNDVFVNTAIYTSPSGQVYDLRFEYLSEHSEGTADFTSYFTASGLFGISNVNAQEDEYFVYKISFVESGSVTITNIDGVATPLISRVILRDLDSFLSTDFSDIGGLISPNSEGTTLGSQVITYNINGQTLFGADFTSDAVGHTDETNWVTFDFSDESEITLVHGVTGDQGTSLTSRNSSFLFVIKDCFDTDEDNIPNYLDLDSDGDGCPDALEGGGSFTTAQLQNDTLTGGVDADGIPLVAGASGQTIGISTDSTQQGAYCTTLAQNDINQTPQDVNALGNLLTNDTDPTGDIQTVQFASGLDNVGSPINIPLGGPPVTIYDENNNEAGTIVVNSDGTYTFDPHPAFTGEVPLEYVAVDSNGDTDTATLSIEVIPADDPATNQPPVANDDTNTTELDTDVSGNVITPNDSDPEGDNLTLTTALVDTDGDGLLDDVLSLGVATSVYGISATGYTIVAGTITLTSTGDYTFDPAPTFVGDVPVDYTVSDGNGGTDDANLTITVEPNDDNNTFANDDASTGNQDLPQSGNVITNDNDPESDVQTVSSGTMSNGNPLTVDGTTSNNLPSGGSLVIDSDGTYSYVPNPSFVGTEVVKYVACDDATPTSACDIATLYLTSLPTNTITSIDDFNNTPYETPVSADVSINDIDPENDNRTHTLDGTNGGMNLADGSVVLNTDGSYTFTPANGFSGETTFEYSVCDDGTPVACDTAIVYIEVLPSVSVEGGPIIANLDANFVKSDSTASGNVMANDFDPDDRPFVVTTTLNEVTVSGIDEDGNPVANAGTLTLNSDGTYEFDPAASFTGLIIQPYTISTSGSPAVTDNSILEILVIDNTENTTFAHDDAEVTDGGVPVSNNVLTNDDDAEDDVQIITAFKSDSDGDGDTETAGVIGTPTQVGGVNTAGTYIADAGDLQLNADGSYTFTPTGIFAGNVIVTYTVCDDVTPTPACDEATLVITILDVKKDYGDGPAIYGDAWHRALTDTNADDILDGATDVWLGAKTDFEYAQTTSETAEGDLNDEALIFGSGAGEFPPAVIPSTNYDIDIAVSSSNSSDVVYYGLWIDWDEDGSYDDFYSGAQTTIAGSGVATVSIIAPASVGSVVNVRLRADDDPLIVLDSIGAKTNGEVEDYQSAIVLPVELISFEGKASDCKVQLNWVSAMEENFSHYELEWSEDGSTFSKKETVEGSRNSSTEKYYQYTDKKAVEKNYYRLKLVDLDGSFEYSKTLIVSTDCNYTEFDLFPNPVAKNRNSLTIRFVAKSLETTFNITDMLGRTVKRLNVATNPDRSNSILLDVSNLPTGSYIMKAEGYRVPKVFIVLE